MQELLSQAAEVHSSLDKFHHKHKLRTFKLSGNTEITSSDNMTFGTLDLGGNRLTLGTGSKGLTLPNTLTMDNVSSAIATNNVNLTLGKALSFTSGSITSTGGTLSFTGGPDPWVLQESLMSVVVP